MEIFKRISGFDVGDNGYTTPERLLINVLPVSPAMRPFVMRNGMRALSDLIGWLTCHKLKPQLISLSTKATADILIN